MHRPELSKDSAGFREGQELTAVPSMGRVTARPSSVFHLNIPAV